EQHPEAEERDEHRQPRMRCAERDNDACGEDGAQQQQQGAFVHAPIFPAMALHPDLVLALALADDADAISMRHDRAHDLAVETKADLTPVTEADKGVEEALRARLERERPGEAIAGEEYGVADGDVRWWLDPIDGT